MAEFSSVQSLQTLVSDCSAHSKAMLQLKVSGASETLTITCPTLPQAESLADLIDGYCRLTNGTDASLWTREGTFVILSKYFVFKYPKNLVFVKTLKKKKYFSKMNYRFSPMVADITYF